MNYDAIVVGGGIIGMLTARNLQTQGMNVALVDKGKLGREATWAAGGILSSLHPWKNSPANNELISEGQKSFPVLANELLESTGIDIELCKSGMLVLQPQQIQQAIKWCSTNHVVIHHVTRELQEIESEISCFFDEALFLKEVLQVRPPLLIKALKKDLQIRGVKIFEHFEVMDLLIKQNHSQGVSSANGSLHSEHTIICNGAWASKLIRSIQDKLPVIRPVRGQMLLFKTSKRLLDRILQYKGFYMIPRRDEFLLCGSTIENVGFNKGTTKEAETQLHQIAIQLIPELRNYVSIKQWSGLRPGTNNESPFIGLHPQIEGLYLNIGHYRYGIAMSMASSRILGEFVLRCRSEAQIPQIA